MAYCLARHGFDVYVTPGFAEAKKRLRMWGCSRPDLVLMDMRLPLSRGLETLHQIRDDEGLADLKVFAVAACTRQPELEPVGRGWDGWFQTPVNMDRVIEHLVAEIHPCAQTVAT